MRLVDDVARLDRVVAQLAAETSCLSPCWAVLDLLIASARGLALTALEHHQLAQMRAARMA